MIGGWGVGGEVGDSGEPLVLRRPGLRRKTNYGQCISAYLSEGVPFTSLTERERETEKDIKKRDMFFQRHT